MKLSRPKATSCEKRGLLVFTLLVLLAPAVSVHGATGKWVETTSGDFGSGELDGVALLSSGRVEIAPETEELLTRQVPYVWSLAADAEGNIYAGVGEDGRIVRIDPAGDAAAFFKTEEMLVLSLATDDEGAVYAGTGPSGAIYKIGKDGDGRVLYRGSETYIWSMAFGPDGSLFAATGDSGRLLKLDPNGEAEVVADTSENHLMNIVVDADGAVFAVSEGDGRVYRFDKDGEVFVLYEPSAKELRGITLDDEGNVYVGTASGIKVSMPKPKPSKKKKGSSQSKKAPGSTVMVSGGSGGAGEDDGNSTGDKPTKAPGEEIKATNSVYRIDPRGNVRRMFRKKGAAVTSLLATPEGLVVGTGNEGKIYLVDDRGKATLVVRADGAQVTAMIASGDERYFATSNLGQVARVLNRYGGKGTYTSTVHDAKLTAQWGRVSWVGFVPDGTDVAVKTRTGNVSEPDDTWTEWSDPLISTGEQITSEPARYIQYRLIMNTDDDSVTPQVDQVVISYLTSNQPPIVGGVSIAAAENSSAGQLAFGSKVNFTWKAADPNGDDLVYAVHFKGAGEKNWKKLKDKLEEPKLEWDTNNVPDGVYRIKVTAQDSPSNPRGRAEEAWGRSERFVIDNTRPLVLDVDASSPRERTAAVSARIEDALSNIVWARFAVDSGDRQMMPAGDGIFDTTDEKVNFTVDDLESGEHTIVIYARDEAGNVGAGKAVVDVK